MKFLLTHLSEKVWCCDEQGAQALTYDELQGLTYLQVKGSGIANTCPVLEGGSSNLKDLKPGDYQISKFCLEPTSFTVKEESQFKNSEPEFVKTKLMTRLTYTLDEVRERLEGLRCPSHHPWMAAPQAHHLAGFHYPCMHGRPGTPMSGLCNASLPCTLVLPMHRKHRAATRGCNAVCAWPRRAGSHAWIVCLARHFVGHAPHCSASAMSLGTDSPPEHCAQHPGADRVIALRARRSAASSAWTAAAT